MRSFFPIKPEEYKKFGLLCLLATAFIALSIILRDVSNMFLLQAKGASFIDSLKLSESLYDFCFIAYFITFSFLLKQRHFFNLTNVLFLSTLCVSYLHFDDHFYVSVFYIACRLFNFYGMMLLFYTFTNSLLSLDEAKRLYPLVLFVSGIPAFGLIFSKFFINFSFLLIAQAHFLMIAIPLFAIIFLAHHYLHESPGKVFEKINISDIKKILTSPVVYLVALIVVFYECGYQFVNFIFKSDLKDYTASNGGFSSHFARYISLYTGFLMTFLAAITIPLVYKKSWRFLGMITPIVLLGTGGLLLLAHPYIHEKETLIYLAGASFILIKAFKYFMILTNQFAYVVRSYAEKSAGRALFEGYISVMFIKLLGIPLSLAMESKTKTINQLCSDNAPFYFIFVLLMSLCVHLLSKVMKKYE